MQTPYPLYLTEPAQVLGLVGGIALFLAVMVGFFFVLNRFQKRGFGSGSLSRRMKTLERMTVSRDTALQLVQIGSRLLLISVGRDGARLICELFPDDLSPSGEEKRTDEAKAKTAAEPADAGVGTRFVHNMKVNMGLLPKGTPYMTGKTARPGTQETVPFDAVLRQMTEKEQNPISEHNQRSGRFHMGDRPSAEPRPPESVRQDMSVKPASAGARTSYQNSIDHLTSLSEPDHLDRRAKPRSALDEFTRGRETAEPEKSLAAADPSSAVPRKQDKPEEGRREERIDALLDRIAERQSRHQKEKEKDRP